MRANADAIEDRAPEVIPPVRPSSPWRIAHLEVLENFRLNVRFNDGTEGAVEMAEFLQSSAACVFARLRDEQRFRQAALQWGAVCWPDGLDLAPDAMYREIKQHGKWIVR